ncbi:hypothetical protein BH23CHL2_BH23CHL2_12510 [soil metagenome]
MRDLRTTYWCYDAGGQYPVEDQAGSSPLNDTISQLDPSLRKTSGRDDNHETSAIPRFIRQWFGERHLENPGCQIDGLRHSLDTATT